MYEWDAKKRQANLAKHGVDFAIVADFEWGGAFVLEDDRYDYGEIRMVAIGRIKGRIHTMVYTERGQKVRVISLRKANRAERNRI